VEKVSKNLKIGDLTEENTITLKIQRVEYYNRQKEN